MIILGTPNTTTATKLLLLGCGELGKEVAIEAQRLGLEVVAVDRYDHAPARQVAHRRHVVAILDARALTRVIQREQPDFIVPEIEAIATDALLELEQQGYQVVPTAKAAQLTMNREGIRRLASETLGLPTSPYVFADSLDDVQAAAHSLGMPCVIKPIMSSSGKGQAVIRCEADIERAWHYSQQGGRSGAGRVIVEGWVPFDYEITLLTVQHRQGCSFCAPIGHEQVDGDYRESWQPHAMRPELLQQAQQIAAQVTQALGGYGLFGVELFICGDQVLFSEVSPRPHDTGLVTLVSQDLSEFALHLRAILGLPIPAIRQWGPAASCALLVEGESHSISFSGFETALAEPDTQLRLFGKPEVVGRRRLGVGLALGENIGQARERARGVVAALNVSL